MRSEADYVEFVATRRTHLRRVAYARKVVLNAVIDERRRPWRRELPVLEQRDSAAPEVPGPEVRDEVVTALQQLPAMQRKTVVLRHWLDLSVEETARELGISTGTVKSHTSRGLATLQGLLTATDHDLAGRTR